MSQRWHLLILPSIVSGSDGGEMIDKILTEIMDETTTESDSLARLREVIALSMATSSAVNYGKPMTESEMDNIVGSLFSLPDPKYDPRGRLVIIEMGLDEIETHFK